MANGIDQLGAVRRVGTSRVKDRAPRRMQLRKELPIIKLVDIG